MLLPSCGFSAQSHMNINLFIYILKQSFTINSPKACLWHRSANSSHTHTNCSDKAYPCVEIKTLCTRKKYLEREIFTSSIPLWVPAMFSHGKEKYILLHIYKYKFNIIYMYLYIKVCLIYFFPGNAYIYTCMYVHTNTFQTVCI